MYYKFSYILRKNKLFTYNITNKQYLPDASANAVLNSLFELALK